MPLSKRTTPLAAAAETPLSLEALLSDLHAADAALRRNAARSLGEAPAAARELCSVLATEDFLTVREAIFTALIRIGSTDVADGLVPLLRSEDVGLRNGAIEVLKTMPAAVWPHVDEILAGSTDVRIFGVEIVGSLPLPGGPRRLIRVIEEETELNVCAAAVDALAECGDRDAIAPLHALLERFPDEPFLEFSVQTALARIANA